MDSKVCKDCREEKSLEKFGHYSEKPDHLREICKKCYTKRRQGDQPQPGEATKRCVVCKQTKVRPQFSRDKACADGRLDTCKECQHAGDRRTPAKKVTAQCLECLQIKPLAKFPQGRGTPTKCISCREQRAAAERAEERRQRVTGYELARDSSRVAYEARVTEEKIGPKPLQPWEKVIGTSYTPGTLQHDLGIAGNDLKDLRERLKVQQNNCCAICKQEFNQKRRASLDHDHRPGGGLRDLLCAPCNLGLGSFQDDPDRLRAAADYIERHRPKLTVLS